MRNSLEFKKLDNKIAIALKKARLARGLSLTAVGELIKVSFQQVQKYENGKNRICASKFLVLSKYLDIDIQSIGKTRIEKTPELSAATYQMIKDYQKLNSSTQLIVNKLIRDLSNENK